MATDVRDKSGGGRARKCWLCVDMGAGAGRGGGGAGGLGKSMTTLYQVGIG